MHSCSLINCRNHWVYTKRQINLLDRQTNTILLCYFIYVYNIYVMLLYITLYTIESYAIMDFIDTCVCASIVSKPICKRCLTENGLCMERGKH